TSSTNPVPLRTGGTGGRTTCAGWSTDLSGPATGSRSTRSRARLDSHDTDPRQRPGPPRRDRGGAASPGSADGDGVAGGLGGTGGAGGGVVGAGPRGLRLGLAVGRASARRLRTAAAGRGGAGPGAGRPAA